MVKIISKIKNKIFPGQNFIDPPEDIIANRPNTITSLLEVKEVFEKNGLKFCLDYGTLLGAVREGTIIPWDHDIDLAAIKKEEDFPKIIKAGKELQKMNYEVYYFLDRNMLNLRTKDALPISLHLYEIDENNNARLDLAIPRTFRGNVYSYWWWVLTTAYHQKNDPRAEVIVETTSKVLRKAYPLPKFISQRFVTLPAAIIRKILSKEKIDTIRKKSEHNSKTHVQFLNYIYDAKDYLSFDSIKFYGSDFFIPSNVDKHLSKTYGPNWKKPNPKYIDENDNLLFVESKRKQKEELSKKV